jgi:HlyD family secretion protein
MAWRVSRLKPAARSVDRSTVWLDTVKRGAMLREVRGIGTLIPEEVLWIPAPAEGRVEKILVKPGALVSRSTVLLTMRNPELETAAVDAAYQVKAAEAQYADLKVRLASERLNQQAVVARAENEFRQAQLKADADKELAKHGLLASVSLRLSLNTVEEAGSRHRIEQERLSIGAESTEAQLQVQKAQVDKLRALERLKRDQVEALTVRAGTDGVLQQLPLEVGQKVGAGAVLAKVAQPEKLKAELKISETQAKDIQLGQKSAIDTRNGVIAGRVARIDPAVKEGTVTVDVRLEGALPQGARPDLSVDGTVELERLEDVVYMARPASGQAQGAVSLFKVGPDGKTAARVNVRLGRTSVSAIEVLEGLRPGDQVILSDTAAWTGHDTVRLQ